MTQGEKRVAIVQSNYIPWKGYFDLINTVDEFIVYDDVQYTRRDWRNRNRIRTPRGVAWLTIPVRVKGRYHQRIDETRVSDPNWAKTHWKTIQHNYAAAPHFSGYGERFEAAYRGADSDRLTDINRLFIGLICEILGIATPITSSSDYGAGGRKTERLVNLCLGAKAAEYVTGPAAKAYLDERAFRDAGIAISYIDYSGYPEYQQRLPCFEHAVTVLDLICNTGSRARSYMKTFGQRVADGGA